MPEESTALFLYSLLQSHGTFVDVLTRSGTVLAPAQRYAVRLTFSFCAVLVGSLPLVLAACLKGLYVLTAKSKDVTSPKAAAPSDSASSGAAAKELNQLYVLVVCVLILVQDGGVLRSLRKNRNIDLRWYAERPSDTVSVVR